MDLDYVNPDYTVDAPVESGVCVGWWGGAGERGDWLFMSLISV